MKLQSGAGVPPTLIHSYFLLIPFPKILNAILVKSEEVTSKNPERCRIQDFLAVRLILEPEENLEFFYLFFCFGVW